MKIELRAIPAAMGVGLLALLFAVGLAFWTPAEAEAAPIHLDSGGIAVKGHDPVAYFSEGEAVRGDSEFSASHDGAVYLFSSAGNRDLFLAEPEKYVPAYGGYCAYGVSQGYKVPIDPEAFSIVDGRLYLNYSKGVRRQWSRDVPGHIERADSNWPGLRHK